MLEKIFDAPFKSYKWRDDLRGLARALGLSDTAKNADLQEAIQEKLENNPDLKANPRFAGLYRIGGRCRTNNITTDADDGEPPVWYTEDGSTGGNSHSPHTNSNIDHSGAFPPHSISLSQTQPMPLYYTNFPSFAGPSNYSQCYHPYDQYYR